MQESVLILERVGFPPLSARGCEQTLTPLISGDLKRTINGDLIYVGQKGHHKYHSIIKCHDKVTPAFEGLWRGSLVKVGCLQKLAQEIISDQLILLKHEIVPGSVNVIDNNHKKLGFQMAEGRAITLEIPIRLGQKAYVFYRPYLMMRVINFKVMTQEWQFSTQWELELEEV